MTRRHRAALTAAATLVAAAGLSAPARADDPTETWTVSTAGRSGAFLVDATCTFGLVLPGRPNSLQVSGVATAPGALSTTIRCDAAYTATATLPGPAAALTTRHLWEFDVVCVSAEATFVTGTVYAPKVCVTP